MAFTSLLKAASQRAQEPADPWAAILKGAMGTASADGYERISTAALYDMLELPRGGRTSGTARRLATIMRNLGWTSFKGFGLNPHGTHCQIRGYARPVQPS